MDSLTIAVVSSLIILIVLFWACYASAVFELVTLVLFVDASDVFFQPKFIEYLGKQFHLHPLLHLLDCGPTSISRSRVGCVPNVLQGWLNAKTLRYVLVQAGKVLNIFSCWCSTWVNLHSSLSNWPCFLVVRFFVFEIYIVISKVKWCFQNQSWTWNDTFT